MHLQQIKDSIHQGFQSQSQASGDKGAGLPNSLIPPTHLFVGQQVGLTSDSLSFIASTIDTIAKPQAINDTESTLPLLSIVNAHSEQIAFKEIYKLSNALDKGKFSLALERSTQIKNKAVDSVLKKAVQSAMETLNVQGELRQQVLNQNRYVFNWVKQSLKYTSYDCENVLQCEFDKLIYHPDQTIRKLGKLAFDLSLYLINYSDGISALQITDYELDHYEFSACDIPEPLSVELIQLFHSLEYDPCAAQYTLESIKDSDVEIIVSLLKRISSNPKLSEAIELFFEYHFESEDCELWENILAGEVISLTTVKECFDELYRTVQKLIFGVEHKKMIKSFIGSNSNASDIVETILKEVEQHMEYPLAHVLKSQATVLKNRHLIPHSVTNLIFEQNEDEYFMMGVGFIINPVSEDNPYFDSFCYFFDDAINTMIQTGEFFEEYTIDIDNPDFVDVIEQRILLDMMQFLLCQAVNDQATNFNVL